MLLFSFRKYILFKICFVEFRVQQLLAQKRDEKTREEAEKAKHEETERRKLGQDLAKLKQWKDERERKEFENSYKKQKEEDRLAREKVRADLERDRSVARNVFYHIVCFVVC